MMDSPETISTPPQPRLYDEEDDEDDDDHRTVDIQRNLNEGDEDDEESPDAVRRGGADEEEEEEEEDEEEEEEGEDTAAENGAGGNGDNAEALSVRATPTLESLSELREIGHEAICWTLSTAKPGNGVEQLQDNSQDTYWQSDGSQPHLLQIQFQRRVAVSHVCLYLDYNLDESYTPKRLSVQVGMTTQDLQTGVFPSIVDMHEPVGWCIIPLTAPPDPLDDPEEDEEEEKEEDDDDENEDGGEKKRKQLKHKRLVRTYLVQIAILSMHQNGRDTHVRQVKLFGPRRTDTAAAAAAVATTNSLSASSDKNQTGNRSSSAATRPVMEPFTPWNTNFATVEVSQFSTIR